MTATYIEVCAPIHHWVGLSVNGVNDYGGVFIPFRSGVNWCPVIELKSGKMVDWPSGTTARIGCRVSEAGNYWLLDENKKRIAKWIPNSVPNDFLCHGDDGYGNFIMMNVNAKGYIYDYKKPEINRREWVDL